MVTGYTSSIVAEARQRLRDLVEGISQVYLIQTRAKDAEQYHYDASSFYIGARKALLAIQEDLDTFTKFIDTNRDKLDSIDYYKYKIDDIDRQIDMLEITIITPSILAPAKSAGTTNLPGDLAVPVGQSFVGKVTHVDDGDTFVVTVVENGASVDRIVRIAGINVPEGGTTRGKFVTGETTKMLLNKEVTVYYDRHTPNDTYGRVLGTVYLGEINYALWLLDNCYAVPLLKFGTNHFVDPEEVKAHFAHCIMGGWPPDGIIKVISSPTHASVWVDGKLNGALTPCEIRLPAGQHTLRLAASGCSSVEDVIQVEPREQELPPYVLPKLPAATGTIIVEVLPQELRAIISIDGNPVGLAPFSTELPAGISVKVTVVANDYQNDEEVVTPVLGKVVRLVSRPKKI
jgi:endonuclease YncB( thermonuclease family)